MVAPSIILYTMYQLGEKKLSNLSLFLSILFIIVLIIKSSTTFLVGMVICLITLVLFKFKNISRLTLFIYFLLFIFSLSTIFLSRECTNRFIPAYGKDHHIINEKLTNTMKKIFNHNQNIKIFANEKNIDKQTDGSLSSAVYFQSIKIMFKSILSKPFGWGLNRYEDAFNFYNLKFNPNWEEKGNIQRIKTFNTKDGSNNFNKLVVEFGIFGLIFYLIVFFFLLSKNIKLDYVIFLLPFIITQSIRGAGYFNGGFILVAFLIIFIFLNKKKLNNL